MKDLVIIGAGGFGREVAEYVRVINEETPTWNFLGFIDDDKAETPEGYKILGNLDYLLGLKEKPYFAIAIANSVAREKIANRCLEAQMQAATIIHPTTLIGPNCEIGEGCIICRNCHLTTNVKIGKFNIINGRCSIGHDAVMGDYCSMMTSALIGGETNIGNHNYFGLRCTMINLIDTCDHCTFGACACIVKDTTEPGTYVGVPAKKIKPWIGNE